MGSFSVVSSTSRVAPLARVSRARASRFSGGLAPFAGSRSASRRRVVVRAAPGPEPDDVQRTAREVREAAREAAREVDELLRRYDELRDDVHLTPDARSNVVVSGIFLLRHLLSSTTARSAGPTRTTRETSRTRTNPRIASVGAGRTTRTTPSPPRAARPLACALPTPTPTPTRSPRDTPTRTSPACRSTV